MEERMKNSQIHRDVWAILFCCSFFGAAFGWMIAVSKFIEIRSVAEKSLSGQYAELNLSTIVFGLAIGFIIGVIWSLTCITINNHRGMRKERQD